MNFIDNLLDRITMYRLVLYFLICLLVAAVGLSLFKVIDFNALAIAFSAGYITLICWITNDIFAWGFETPVNTDSVFITALILALIIRPYQNPHDLLFLTAASGLAIASKFILAINKKHIFNPAAIAVALLALGAGQSATWWVGTTWLVPFVVIGGLLVIRKIQHEAMVGTYLLAAIVSSLVLAFMTHHAIGTTLDKTILHSSLFFLAFVMLTEPLTSPATNQMRLWYAALVGLLFSPLVHIGSLYSTPELTLIVGNVFAYIVSPKYKLLPKLKEKLRLAPDIVDFIFVPERVMAYKPGQYMEWTVAHNNVDNRGNRRYLTLASSPTEENLRLGVKFYPNGSTYKRALLNMKEEEEVAAGQLGGDFVMPDDAGQKLVFIAGGIGVTPYRSMIKYLLDTNERRDIVLLYSAKTQDQLVYRDIFDAAAQKLGTKVFYSLTDTQKAPPNWPGPLGYIDANQLQHLIPDFEDRLFYVSGPHYMVQSVESSLKELGLPSGQIKTDLFPGYA